MEEQWPAFYSHQRMVASCTSLHDYKSRYNNGLTAKLMLMWRREERREMIH
jgi:hypothetical protein